jgi:hypothetical protein
MTPTRGGAWRRVARGMAQECIVGAARARQVGCGLRIGQRRPEHGEVVGAVQPAAGLAVAATIAPNVSAWLCFRQCGQMYALCVR